MDRLIYCKFNETRNPLFQTKTCIYEKEGRRYVTKSPASKEARSFVLSFPQKYQWTKSIYTNMKFLPCRLEGDVVLYDYLVGKSLDSVIRPYIFDIELLVTEIQKCLKEYYKVSESVRHSFKDETEYREIFGDILWDESEKCIRPVNLDVIFDNLILGEDGKATVYDYEWVFDITVPEKYILYRILSRIYDKYFETLSKQIDFEDFVYRFDFNESDRKKCAEMEKRFIAYVYNNGESVLVNEDIIGNRTDASQLLMDYRNLLMDYRNLVSEYDKTSAEFLNLAGTLTDIYNSKSWKLAKPLRGIEKAYRKMRRRNWKNVKLKIRRMKAQNKQDYLWFPTEDELEKQRNYQFKINPKISIITPLFKTDIKMLREMIDSVIAQTYSNWELCLIDFSPEDYTQVADICKQYVEQDERIKFSRDTNVNIPENMNKCVDKSTGEYIAILDHDDIFHPSVLFEAMREIENGADFVYSDEIKFENDLEHCYAPALKPDFSFPELCTRNFICHFNLFKKSLMDEVGHYRTEANGSQDHDIVLRLAEKAEKIVHIPKILYYWRTHPGSVASGIDAKPYATWAGIWSVDQYLNRNGINVTCKSVIGNIPTYRLNAPAIEWDKVMVLVWKTERTKQNQIDKSIASVRKCHSFKDNQIIVVERDKVVELLKHVESKSNQPYMLLLQAGTVVANEDAIQEMAVYLRFPNVKYVDAKIIDQNKNILSCGVSVSKQHKPEVWFRGEGYPESFLGFENDFLHARAVNGVSGIFTLVDTTKVGKESVWTPFALGQINTKECNRADLGLNIIYENTLPERDPYFNKSILDCGLE